MPFHFTDPDGDELIIEPTSRYGRPAISLRHSRSDSPEVGAAVHVFTDQTEALVAGIRDIARQAATLDTPTGRKP